jgi:hypothetical protein
LLQIRDVKGVLPRRPAFSPDGAWIVAGNRLLDTRSGALRTLPLSPLYKSPALSTFTPNGTIAITREDGVIELFCPK